MAYKNALIGIKTGENLDIETEVKKALINENYPVREINPAAPEIKGVALKEVGKEITSTRVTIPTGTSVEPAKTYKIELITETKQGNVQGNMLNYVLIDGLYHLLRIENNKIYIDKQSYYESELISPEFDEDPEITLQVNNLPNLVKFKDASSNSISDVNDNAIIHKDDEVYVYTQVRTITEDASISVSIQNQQTPFEIAIMLKYITIANAIEIDNTSSDKSNKLWTNIYTTRENNITKKYMAMNTNEEINLTKKMSPGYSNETVEWISSDPTIATIDENGKVSGIKEGTVEITATTEVSNLTDKIIVVVTEYGEIVDYSVEIGNTILDNWKIFYKEGNNSFIIYGDYLPNYILDENIIYNNLERKIVNFTGMDTVGTYRLYWDYNSIPPMQSISNEILELFKANAYGLNEENINSRSISNLLETSFWDILISDNLKERNIKAIGSPTLEMWIESYNDVYVGTQLEYRADLTSYGYEIKRKIETEWQTSTYPYADGNKLYYPYTTDLKDPDDSNLCKCYILSSPSKRVSFPYGKCLYSVWASTRSIYRIYIYV